jgi:hypothetical protein
MGKPLSGKSSVAMAKEKKRGRFHGVLKLLPRNGTCPYAHDTIVTRDTQL